MQQHFILQCLPLGLSEYVNLYNHQANCPFYMWPDVCPGDFPAKEKSMVIHIVLFTHKCPGENWVSLMPNYTMKTTAIFID